MRTSPFLRNALRLMTTVFYMALSACVPQPTPPATPPPTPVESQLTAPHDDGLYLVGVDIASGKWISAAGPDRLCYWVRRKYDGIILQNYYGPDGGVIVIQPGDYEVEFAGCGIWEYAEEN